MRLKTLTAADIETLRPSLTALLADTVANGASIGFYPPVGGADADRYWREVEQGIRDGKRVVIAAFDQRGVLLGSGQIALESRDNGLHRAEVQKVMVAPLARRQGVGRALMMALEQSAREAGRTLLVLDTREGDPAERMYLALGWEPAGRIPGYVREHDGTSSATRIFYRSFPPSLA